MVDRGPSVINFLIAADYRPLFCCLSVSDPPDPGLWSPLRGSLADYASSGSGPAGRCLRALALDRSEAPFPLGPDNSSGNYFKLGRLAVDGADLPGRGPSLQLRLGQLSGLVFKRSDRLPRGGLRSYDLSDRISQKTIHTPGLLLAGAVDILISGFLVVYFLSWGNAPEWIRYPEPSATAYYQWTDHDSLTNLPSPPTGPERSAYYFSLLDQVATLHGGDYLLGHCSKPLAPRLLDIVESITAGYPYALRITQPGSNYFSNMSVRHLILNHPDALPLEKALFRRLEGGGGLYDYRLESTLPRVFTQDRSVLCSSEEAMNELMNGDLRSAVFIEDGKQLAANGKQWGEGGEKLVSYNAFLNLGQGEKDIEHFDELQKRNQIYRVWYPNSNLMNIEIDVKVPALLITTDVFYAGWEVCVDGEEKIPLRVNYFQRGVWLDEGNHVVKWAFRPPAVKWGFLCMGTGLLGLVVLLVWPRRRERVK